MMSCSFGMNSSALRISAATFSAGSTTVSKVAALIRKALEYIPKEQLVISTDCGFGREGLSRRIAFYKCIALVEGTNIVRRELGLPEARVRAADPKLWVAKR